jgi:exosortase family protein XrtG
VVVSLWLLAPLFVLWVAGVAFLRRHRVWIAFYLLATVGLVYWVVVAGQTFGLELRLAQSVAWAVSGIANAVGVPTRIFEGAPGVLLVLVVAQEVGWTVLQVGVESSGLLEISVLAALLLFYPGWSRARRLQTTLLGSAGIWLANILRMLVIVVMLNRLGKDALVLAHNYAGKALFFVLAIAIFWFLITRTTVRDLGRRSA